MAAHSNPFGMPTLNITASGNRTGQRRGARMQQPMPSDEAVARHDQLMSTWVAQLHPNDGTDYSRIPASYLRELYPYVYYWGVKADILLSNLQRMNELRAAELAHLQALPGYTYNLVEGSFTEDLLLTYRETKLAGLLLREDVLGLMPYLHALHEAQLFQVAYRNVTTAEVHEDNLISRTEHDTPLHDYYNSVLGTYIPLAWKDNDGAFSTGDVQLVQSVFMRICLGEPVMNTVAEVAGDWAIHEAFCARWGLVP